MPFIIDARNMGGGSIGSAAGGDTSTGTRNNVTLAAPWDESKEYLKGDLATNNGDLYQAQKSVPAGVKISDEDYWALVVAGDKSKETEQLRKDIGSLGDLETESKDNLVNAINEVGSIQPDWNQNDETKKDYIKGRTHYTYKERKTLYENNAISSSPIKINDNPFSLEVGKTYIVEFDGIEYEIICKSYNGRFAYIGNLYFGTHNANLDSGEPFYIDDMLIYVELGNGTHSIALIEEVEKVHQIDPKYIEDMYYSEEAEVVVGTGYKGWETVTQKKAVSIPKVTISSKNETYKNVQVSSENIPFITYIFGNYEIEINIAAQDMYINIGDFSKNDLQFYQTQTVCHPVPDEYMPEWVLTAEQIGKLTQADWTTQSENDLRFIRHKPSVIPSGAILYSPADDNDLTPANKITVYYNRDKSKIAKTSFNNGADPIISIKTGEPITETETPYGCMVVYSEYYYNKTYCYCLNPLDIQAANKTVLDSITGIVTADKLTSPDHSTDLVAYDAFQAAVPSVQSMGITGAQVGQTIKVKAVNGQGMPIAWEAADMSADEQWELLGTLDASTGDVLQLDFSNPVKKLYFYSSLCDTAGEQYGASTTVYRQVAFKVGDTWRDVNSFKIGCCKHSWCWKTRYWLECGANLPYPKGEWTETLSAGNVVIKLTPLEIGNNNQYSSGLVSGIRFSLVLPDGTENTASGTIKVWGVKA